MTKVAIVTGNAKGLGKTISEALPALGYEQSEIIRSADYDLKRPEACEKLIKDTIERHGRLDLLVNNLGNYAAKPLEEISIEECEDMIHSNYSSALYLSKYALSHLRESKGQIVNIGFAGLENFSPMPNVIVYQAAKAALLTLTKGLAKAEAENLVRVNMVSPGSMENTVKHNALEKIPFGRLASLEEVKDAVVFMIENDYITGQNIDIAGGWAL